jgi:nucleoside-diphosphate-sugar epimerase
MTTLITGGAGFVGTNLADRLACEGERVLVFDNLSRAGVEENLAWLAARHPNVEAVVGALAGRAFNIGGGPANAMSLRELLALVEELQGAGPDGIARLLAWLAEHREPRTASVAA